MVPEGPLIWLDQIRSPCNRIYIPPRTVIDDHHHRMLEANSQMERIPLLSKTSVPRSYVPNSPCSTCRKSALHKQFPCSHPKHSMHQVLCILNLALLCIFLCTLLTLFLHHSPGDHMHITHSHSKLHKILPYLGGMGPYIHGQYIPPPCPISQIHLLSRHGERYPTTTMFSLISQFAKNISNQKFHGDLAFLNKWDLNRWIDYPDGQLNQETLTSHEAGSLRMFNLGVEFRGRYSKLWNFTSHGKKGSKGRRIRVWSSDSQRVIDSAKYLAMGFYGIDQYQDVEWEVVPETKDRWADSLTPSYSPASKRRLTFQDTRARFSLKENIPHWEK